MIIIRIHNYNNYYTVGAALVMAGVCIKWISVTVADLFSCSLCVCMCMCVCLCCDSRSERFLVTCPSLAQC